jgi:hypothetical protein
LDLDLCWTATNSFKSTATFARCKHLLSDFNIVVGQLITHAGGSMPPQVSRQDFELALREMGHDPTEYKGKKLSLAGMVGIYEIEEDIIIEAIKRKHIAAHYDYNKDTIWIDALDAAHFYYCIRTEAHLYAR